MTQPLFVIGDSVFFLTEHNEIRQSQVTAVSLLGGEWRYEVPGRMENLFDYELSVTFRDAVEALKERLDEKEPDERAQAQEQPR